MVLGLPRSTHRPEPLIRGDEEALTNNTVGLAARPGRYGYRRITTMLRRGGWVVNHKRVERICLREGLKVPARQLRNDRAVQLLTIIDEYTRECLAIRAGRNIPPSDVIETPADLMISRIVPEHTRCDNGPECTARAVREWLGKVGAKTLYIEPASP